MPFYTGTIVGGGSAALMAKVEECLALSPTYWEYVEQATVSGYDYRIWKNKGHAWAGNSEFFMYFHAPAGSPSFYSRPFEEWNSGTKKCTGMISTATSGSSTLDSLGRIGETDPTRTSNGGIYIGGLPTAETTYGYFIVVGPQGIYIFTTVSTNHGYMGLYEPSGVYASGEFPLCALQYTSSPQPKLSRMPGLTGAGFSYNVFNITLTNEARGAIPTGYPQLAGKSVIARQKIIDYYNVYRGLAPAWMLASNTPDTGVVFGDTITIGGVTYTLCGNSYGYNWIASNA